MGLWTTLLSAAVPAIFGNKGQGKVLAGAAGEMLGGMVDKKNAQREARKLGSQYYVNLAADAKAGGFHPLEALRAGGGVGYADTMGRMPIGTTTAMQNAHDKVQEVISGRWAEDRAMNNLNMELRRVQIDEARRGRLASVSAPPDDGGVDTDGDGNIETGPDQVDAEENSTELSPTKLILTKDGPYRHVILPGDFDELVMGGVLDVSAKVERYFETLPLMRRNQITVDAIDYFQRRPEQLQWQRQNGAKPPQWDNLNPRQKYLVLESNNWLRTHGRGGQLIRPNVSVEPLK